MNNFKKIINDESLINIYAEISKKEDIEKGWAHHNLNHVINVANLVEKLLISLNYDNEFIEEAKIAAILHDIGCLEGKDNHAQRGYEYAKEYLKTNGIKLGNEKLVLEAIKNHSDGFDTDNIIQLVLILCDKLDIKYTRVAKEGYNIKGIRQYQYIEDILINIEKDILTIKFVCNENIDKNELEEFYFTKKVFKAIQTFCDKIKIKYNVLINEEKWDAIYN